MDGIDFVHDLQRRWPVIALACLVAVALTALVSMAWPKRYTATSTLLIEPPAGNDPRAATAVSPVYLESLKTYERFASSDTVFASALRDLNLQGRFAGRGIESIKRSVLKVSRPTNTKIVEISVTLENPVSAQKLAQHIAEAAVALNRRLTDQSTEDVLDESRRTLDRAAVRLKTAEASKDVTVKTDAMDALQNEIAEANQLNIAVGGDLSKARAELADMEAEMKTFHPGDGMDAQAQWTSRQIEALRARIVSLQAQAESLGKSLAAKTTVLEERKQRRESVEAELHSARADYEATRTKLSDAQNSAAYRGERLEIMDPGIVPQKPSFPNTPLNVMLAFLASVIASIACLAARFAYSHPRRYAAPEYSVR